MFIKTLLIAYQGEVATRIARAPGELGIRAIGVHSAASLATARDAHVRGDWRVQISGALRREERFVSGSKLYLRPAVRLE
jgi:acetyl/propionyl-CoA carboxylase alpha subunit